MRAHLESICLAAATVLLAGIAAWGQEPKAEVRASIQSTATPWVGQKVVINIQLLAPGYFASAPRFDFPEIPGVILVPPEGRPVLSTEIIDGKSYTVQSYDIALFAKRVGLHDIAPFKIRFNIKRSPLDSQEVPQEVDTPAVSFTAKLSPGADTLTSLISASDLKVEETWKPTVETGKVGDAFTRTIAFTASDVPGMAFPPFPGGKIEGLGIYPKSPDVSDKSESGKMTGRPCDTLVYVSERPGQFTIPATRLTWWNLDTEHLEIIDLPPRKLVISTNAAFPTSASKPPLWGNISRISNTVIIIGAAITLALLTCAASLWRIRESLRAALRPTHLKPLNPLKGS